ncbi:TetR/AcrR family transcriptional regulator [Rhizobium sp. S152]|uniref:TetR/AcrR family transcriptional regulator n=1 Tax=Rhizobium sp. S152 TaxID=3055038 RepID=UPI0025A9C893|nr:TetR/AcrR family transcriptional regulator [Rhizobium sp. S152]MDM9628508.1 TetR/AcrR family transcriptional regulator [Rhizobium sp. S152]
MGRPREFDPEEALEVVMRIFWQRGYEATSLNDLTDALKITKTSLYHAFGKKDALFGKAFDRYRNTLLSFIDPALESATSLEVVSTLLHGFADVNTKPGTPTGCLVTNAAIVGSEEAEPVRLDLIRGRVHLEAKLTQRLERAKAEGDLPADADPSALASMVMIFSHGMSIQASSGASREGLHAAVDQLLASWPRA